ncbi:MAG: T9SS type A sorting domain-containing protein [Ignavibacteria bacterium]|nr:T9SS type A sorting domain-containing protein [Ignavibacteria bacterium]
MATNLYNQLQTQFPNDPLLVDALILLGDDPSTMLAKVKINQRQNLHKKNEVQKSDVDNLIVKDFSLEQNYPNPFNPVTIIQYQIPVAGNVKLKIFDILGREVTELINQEQTEGVYRIIFDIDSHKKLSSGVYYYVIEVKGSDGRNYRNVKKMTILK